MADFNDFATINLYNYIKFIEIKYNTKLKIKEENNKTYVLLYRYDTKDIFGKDIFKIWNTYKNTIQEYKGRHYWTNYSGKSIKNDNDKDKTEIIVSFYGANKYQDEFEDMDILSEFWLPIMVDDKPIDITVKYERKEEDDDLTDFWYPIIISDYSTNNNAKHEKCDFIAVTEYSDIYPDLIVTDNGIKKVEKIIQEYGIEKKECINTNFNMKGGSNYYGKYKKYKEKYLRLKNL